MADELPQTGEPETGTEVPQTPQAETPPADEVEKETAPEAEPTPDDEEPGYDKNAYQRKLYQEAKRAKQIAQAEREARIAAEARAKALEEQRTQAPEPKRYTPQQVQAAIDANQISTAEGAAYLADLKVRDFAAEQKREQAERETALRPIRAAVGEIQTYVQAAPYLADDTDERTQKVAQQRQVLIQQFGLADNYVTTALAIRQTLGPPENLQRRREVSELTRRGTTTHAAPPAGGTNQVAGSAVSKVPASMVQDWKDMGATSEEIEKYAKRHLEKQARRAGKFGL